MVSNNKLPKGLIFKNNEFKQRIRWNFNGFEKEIHVSLDTDSLTAAKVRRDEVISYRNSIISGEQPLYTWQKGDANEPTFNSTYSVETAKNQYIEYCKVERLSETTIELYENSINLLISLVGGKKDITKINDTHIQVIKKLTSMRNGKPLSSHTINRHIRAIGTMFNWLSKSKRITGLPECQQLRTPNTLPRYYTDNEFNKIIVIFDKFFQSMYKFYRETGLRLSQPFISDLAGNYLIIPPNSTKNVYERHYFLNDQQVQIVQTMRNYIFDRLKSDIVKTMKSALQPITRRWSDRVQEVGLSDDKRKFHCLRHTFCVRHYYKCRDLYEVQMLMGHSDIQQTQKYAKLWHNLIGKLENEFTNVTPQNDDSGTNKRDYEMREKWSHSNLSREMRV